MKPSRSTALALVLPWLLTLAIFWLFPLVISFVMGFTDFRLLVKDYQWVGLANYRALLTDQDFIQALKNTFIFVLGTIPVTTVLSLSMALLVSRRFKGRGVFRAAYFLPSITLNCSSYPPQKGGGSLFGLITSGLSPNLTSNTS